MPQLEDGRTELSQILVEKREWIPVEDSLPPTKDTPVIIRAVNRNKVLVENKEKNFVYHAEDTMIATYDDDTKEWSVYPPHLRFDYSPITENYKINKESLVTHWAYPMQEEVDAWKLRLLPTCNVYKDFDLKVDDDNLEDVYRTFAWSAEALRRIYLDNNNNPNVTQEEKDNVTKFIRILYDMQYMIDSNTYFENGELKYKEDNQ